MVAKLSERNGNSFFRPSALFWPQYLEYQSAWFEHGPFAFWLMDILRPRCFVELGTHTGYSYFCFCQAVQRLHLGTSCYAIDTWTGDEHSGTYGEEVFHAVANHNQLYTSFSTLICTTFDDAVGYFPGKKIDLLHIDGRHFYDDVRHDFESWRDKLTDDAIILFHDTNVRERQFGVWKLFEELKKKHSTFEFKHGHGLGVVALNKIPQALKSFFEYDQTCSDELRVVFSTLGNAITKAWQTRAIHTQLLGKLANFETEKTRTDADELKLTETVSRLSGEKHKFEVTKLLLETQIENLSDQIERIAPLEQKPEALSLLLDFNNKQQLSQSVLNKLKHKIASRLLPQKAKLNAVEKSIFFDADWYLTTYPDVGAINMNPAKHYLEFGAFEGRDPGPLFSTEQYFSKYPHIAGSKINPLVHISNLRKKQREEPEKLSDYKNASQTEIASLFNYQSSDFVPVPLLHDARSVKSDTRLVAFYLPQFHPIPENDEWWGKGFTEWTNVTRALPQFEGHYQPHLPGELGFYDLRNPDVQKRQSELAKLYGISAFCIYFYWFNGRILLEKPLQNIIENVDIKQDFCLCWANENWSRRWDGLDQELLIEQHYSPEDDIAFIEHIGNYMKDPRYLRISGKPVLIIYRPQLLPSMKETAARWRAWCKDNGLGEIYLVCTHSFGQIHPDEFGCDAAVEFPPNNAQTENIKSSRILLNKDYDGRVYDWSVFVDRSKSYAQPDYGLFRTVCPMWDNEARKSGKGYVFVNSSPACYGEWLYNAVLDTSRNAENKEEQLVFINAWNEWAEGAHLEPDRRHGYAYLEATRMALTRASIVESQTQLTPSNVKLAVVIHAFYLDVFDKILDRLGKIDTRSHIFVTTTNIHEDHVRLMLKTRNLDGTVFVFENRGRDVLPFILALKQIDADEYPFVLKLHSKKSTHRSDGDEWCKDHLDCLATPEQVNWILEQMCSDPKIGLVGAKDHVVSMKTYLGSNLSKVRWLANRMGMSTDNIKNERFIAGTMFLARRDALEPLLNLALTESDFEEEMGQTDATTAHAIERVITYSAKSVGLDVVSVGPKYAVKKLALSRKTNVSFKFAAPT